MPDFSKRHAGPEMMDDLFVAGRDLHQALHELEAINYLLGGNYVTLNGLSQLLESASQGGNLSIADLGCGSGDMLKLIRRLLEKRGNEGMLSGIDANPNVIRFAHSNTPSSCRIQYETLDIFSEEFRSRQFDIVTGTLFFHHFDDDALVGFFKQLKEQVSLGIVINDIHRHWFSYYAIKWLTKLFSRSAMVKHDAPVSVLRAFKKREIKEILRLAGIERYKVKWCWAFRWQIVIRF
jgi:2-polyprenyl-3-methyl-5-hydroxy-6-metoxy-1,4-benzoquinol methylase